MDVFECCNFNITKKQRKRKENYVFGATLGLYGGYAVAVYSLKQNSMVNFYRDHDYTSLYYLYPLIEMWEPEFMFLSPEDKAYFGCGSFYCYYEKPTDLLPIYFDAVKSGLGVVNDIDLIDDMLYHRYVNNQFFRSIQCKDLPYYSLAAALGYYGLTCQKDNRLSGVPCATVGVL